MRPMTPKNASSDSRYPRRGTARLIRTLVANVGLLAVGIAVTFFASLTENLFQQGLSRVDFIRILARSFYPPLLQDRPALTAALIMLTFTLFVAGLWASHDLRKERAVIVQREFSRAAKESPDGPIPVEPHDSPAGTVEKLEESEESSPSDAQNDSSKQKSYPQVISALVAALTDTDPSVRNSAAEALGNLETADAIPGLVHALSDADGKVRSTAASALGHVVDRPRAHASQGCDLRDTLLLVIAELDTRVTRHMTELQENQRLWSTRQWPLRLIDSWGASWGPVILGVLLGIVFKK